MGMVPHPRWYEAQRSGARNVRLNGREYDRILPVQPDYDDTDIDISSIGLTPFIRENDVNFAARNLKPETVANMFFDDVVVTQFCQRASVINVASASILSSLKINQGIFGSSSKAYAEVLGTSATGTQNLIYVNDNFITFEINKGSGAADLTDNEFRVDDLVYQTPTNDAFTFNIFNPGSFQPDFTFLGKVKKWQRINASLGYLVVDPISGTANTFLTSSISHNIWNLSLFSGDVREVAVTVANNRFGAGDSISFASDPSSTGIATVSSSNPYVALSSVTTGANTNNLRSIVLSTNNISRDGLSTIVGNNITIVSGTNMGYSGTVVAIASNTTTGWTEAILGSDLPAPCTSNSVYSIGNHVVDDVGGLYGIFHIPSENNLRWLTGERVFTIADTASHNDNNYKMRAIAKYTALGKTNTTENARNFVLREQTPNTKQAAPKVINETQKINDRKYMAQTFFTPKNNEIVNGEIKNAYGIFLTSIDLFFKSKPTDNDELLPFTVALSKVDNGLPSNDIIAERTLEPYYINVSSSPSTSNAATRTTFRFVDPVYLLPGTEYAIKLMTESADYEVWTATLGGTYTDDTGNVRRISEQPYVGNFFKSQNASNWNPILNQDLMFRLNRAQYSTQQTVNFNLVPNKALESNTIMDSVKLLATEQNFAPTSISYEIKTLKTDGTVADFVKINNNQIYDFGKDTEVSSIATKRRRYIQAGNVSSIIVRATMATTDTSVAPVINKERMGLQAFQNIINNAGIANNLISITSGGVHANAANISVTITAPDVGSNRATANVLPSQLVNGRVTGVNIINPGAGYYSTPRITFVEASATANATGVINGETDASGGNILAKYQTKVVTLDEGFDAGDLVVRLNAVKPSGTDVQVYFKVLSGQDSDAFSSKKWQRMVKVADNISPDLSKAVPLEYRYSLTKGTIEYFDGEKILPLGGKFKYFAVKIRLVSADPTISPVVESLKVIAVPGG